MRRIQAFWLTFFMVGDMGECLKPADKNSCRDQFQYPDVVFNLLFTQSVLRFSFKYSTSILMLVFVCSMSGYIVTCILSSILPIEKLMVQVAHVSRRKHTWRNFNEMIPTTLNITLMPDFHMLAAISCLAGFGLAHRVFLLRTTRP